MDVPRAFLEQAWHCHRLGSPFTALLCDALGNGLDGSSDIERHILGWPGDPGAFGDSVPLRVAGALHYLVRAGRAPELAELYPPHTLPDGSLLRAAARRVLANEATFVREFLRHPPQTNEVGRSAPLIAGWLAIAARTRLPLSLFEFGASAGLNLIADRYSYVFGETPWSPDPLRGPPDSESAGLALTCGWKGPRPAVHVALRVRSRRGCDRHPLNIVDPTQRQRLVAYVWADQRQRLERLDAAIRTMRAAPVLVEVSDAAEWIPSVLPTNGDPGVARVLFHSVVWSYLDRITQERIASHLDKVGAASTPDRPLAWLRLELAGQKEPAALRLTMWPGGKDELLARVHPHGAWIRWCD